VREQIEIVYCDYHGKAEGVKVEAAETLVVALDRKSSRPWIELDVCRSCLIAPRSLSESIAFIQEYGNASPVPSKSGVRVDPSGPGAEPKVECKMCNGFYSPRGLKNHQLTCVKTYEGVR